MTIEEVAKSVGDEPHNAQQKWTELRDLLEFLEPRKPKRILEIGVYKGGTVKAWTFVASNYAKIVGVDLPGGDFGGGFDGNEGKAIKKLAQHSQDIVLYPMDSHQPGTIKTVKIHAPYDFIFIDGDHTYEGVKQDYENYYPMLKDGGVMAFHDIAEMNQEEYPDAYVYGLWQELKNKHETKEFVDLDFSTDWGVWGGIGVLIK